MLPEHYRQIFQEALHKQCFGTDPKMTDILWEDDGVDKDGSDWVTDSDWVLSEDGECNE
jgi:hypothetical protein